MTLTWTRETPAKWDEDKARLIGGAPTGTFRSAWADAHQPGELVPGDWWRVEEDGELAGYGWMDVTWGDAEILLVTAPEKQGQGVGTFILDHLTAEATERGLNYVYNVLSPEHPNAEKVRNWLSERGFEARDGGRLGRRAASPRASA